jgi:hypothetical protein
MVAPRVTLPDAIFLRSKHARNLSRTPAETSSHLALAAYSELAIEVKSRPRHSLQADHGSISSCFGVCLPRRMESDDH